MATAEKSGALAPVEIPPLDRNLDFRTAYAGTGRNGPTYTGTLILDGKKLARVDNEGDGVSARYDFENIRVEQEYEEWARKVTGAKYDALERIIYILRERRELQKYARQQAKKGYAFAMMILVGPEVGKGERLTPYIFFKNTSFVPLKERADAERVAAAHQATFYMVSEELPAGAVATLDDAARTTLKGMLAKRRKKEPEVLLAVLVRSLPDSNDGRIYYLTTENALQGVVGGLAPAMYVICRAEA